MDQQEFFPRAIAVGRSRPLGVVKHAIGSGNLPIGSKRVRYHGISRKRFACAKVFVCIDEPGGHIYQCLDIWTSV